jgi:hypothetical protein
LVLRSDKGNFRAGVQIGICPDLAYMEVKMRLNRKGGLLSLIGTVVVIIAIVVILFRIF